MVSPPVLIGFILSFVFIACAAEELGEKKFNHAYVLQDLETYQTPSTAQDTNANKGSYYHQDPNANKGSYYPQDPNANKGSYYNSKPSPVNYNSNPYLPRPQPPPQNTLPVSPTLALVPQPTAALVPQPTAAPVQQAPPPVVQTPPVAGNGYVNQSPAVPNGNTYGPHIYSAPSTTYSSPQISFSDLQNSPVLIVVKNPTTLSYDMAYASTGLGNLDRDTNSQTISRLLLNHSDKVGIVYPTNSFPINSYPDFPIKNLILPEDMTLAKMFNFYPRYIPIMFLMTSKGYQKVARDTTLTHLGQYKYE